MKVRKAIRSMAAAILTGYSPDEVRELARMGILPARKVSGEWMFLYPEILEWAVEAKTVDVEGILMGEEGGILAKVRMV